MNLIKTLGIFFVALAFFFGLWGLQSDTGPHGGIMKPAGINHMIEMNSADNTFYCWLLDKNAKPISNENITCEVKFFFADSSIVDSKAMPFGKDGFTIEHTGIFFSCQVTFNIQGKSISAKFESPGPIVKEN